MSNARNERNPGVGRREPADSRDPRGPADGGESVVDRDEASAASRRPSVDPGTAELLRCVVNCMEHVVRELPRGGLAQLDAARQEIRKAREALGESPGSNGSAPRAPDRLPPFES
jgi:hypothetical protein